MYILMSTLQLTKTRKVCVLVTVIDYNLNKLITHDLNESAQTLAFIYLTLFDI